MKKSEQCCCQTQLNRTEWYFAPAAFCQAVKAVTDSSAPSVNDNDGYGYNEAVSEIRQLTAVESEVSNYLADSDRCLATLNKYPTVKAAFTKFNTTLPSSATVERQCSALVDKSRRPEETSYQTTTWNKKAQLSLTNPRDAKACQKLLQFDVLTTLSQTILA